MPQNQYEPIVLNNILDVAKVLSNFINNTYRASIDKNLLNLFSVEDLETLRKASETMDMMYQHLFSTSNPKSFVDDSDFVWFQEPKICLNYLESIAEDK